MGDPFPLVWLTGVSCDGCTIRALGDTTGGGVEALVAGRVEGVSPVRLLHPLISVPSGQAFMDGLRRLAAGDGGPFGLVTETALPDESAAGDGFFAHFGHGDQGRHPATLGDWVERLATAAEFVVAWGDCAVWGGPHSLAPNPTGSTGTSMRLGPDFRSRGGLPVVNLPGCAPPDTLLGTLIALLRWSTGVSDPPELDEMGRPAAYAETWKGAFVSWQE